MRHVFGQQSGNGSSAHRRLAKANPFVFVPLPLYNRTMKFITDLHIHSKYSRAVSQKMTLENLGYWAQIKGVTVLAVSDFTYPRWFSEIKEKLEEAEPGLFKLKRELIKKDNLADSSKTRFVLGTELSSIYSKKGGVRRIHNLVFLKKLSSVEKFNQLLESRGFNLRSDGRPILGLDSKDLLKIILDIEPETGCLIPAHAWTPWFSVFGSMSGFDSLTECFDELTPHIFAIETGLSSDPQMNWRLSSLDKIALISNSDSHSLERIGREANVFDIELSYDAIFRAIKEKDQKKLLFTIEYFPEEGKYHFDGHRLCKVNFSPSQTKEHKGLCPACGRKLTIGVMNRVEALADRKEGFVLANAPTFKNLVPLDQIIAEALGVGSASKKVKDAYFALVQNLGNELNILLDTSIQEIARYSNDKVARGVELVRQGAIELVPGFDGEYGKVKIFTEAEIHEQKQTTLF